jgi:hypothetical protein
MRTVLLFVSDCLGIDNIGDGINSYHLTWGIGVDVGNSEIGFISSGLLVLEIISQFPGESFEKPLEFKGENIIVLIESDQQLHMVPVRHSQE